MNNLLPLRTTHQEVCIWSPVLLATDVYLDIEKDEAEFGAVSRQLEASPIAQLVRAPH